MEMRISPFQEGSFKSRKKSQTNLRGKYDCIPVRPKVLKVNFHKILNGLFFSEHCNCSEM